jgi:hypothetical protein
MITTKRFCLVDRSNKVVEGPFSQATDFTGHWSVDRELVVCYSEGLRPGDQIEVERGEQVTPT